MHVDILTLGADIAIVSETWFKKRHADDIVQLPGYVCYRKDHVGRVGGDVAIYIQDTVTSCVYVLPEDDSKYEISQFIILSIFLSHIEVTLDSISLLSVNPCIIVAGDFN